MKYIHELFTAVARRIHSLSIKQFLDVGHDKSFFPIQSPLMAFAMSNLILIDVLFNSSLAIKNTEVKISLVTESTFLVMKSDLLW